LKLSKIGVITLLLFGLVIGMTGIVCADQVVPAVPETQELMTTTTAEVVGLATETDAGAWTLTNNPSSSSGMTVFVVTAALGTGVEGDLDSISQFAAALQTLGGSMTYVQDGPGDLYQITQMNIPTSALSRTYGAGTWAWQGALAILHGGYSYVIPGTTNGIHEGVLNSGQVQYTTAYDANIVGQAGQTVLVKSMNLDTRNKVIGQSNLDAKTALTFIATDDGGNVVGSENLLIDGAGMNTTASDRMLCPFAAATSDVIPSYCNIVQAGSKYDLTVGSVTTNANDRFVGKDATNPVVLNYDINVKPYGTTAGQIPAIGSASAYIKAHIQEARGNATVKNEDLTYSETSAVTGTITAFQKVIAYQSGKALL
jgi:hypothetical protein